MAGYLKGVYKKLYSHFGPQHWWPAENAFEVVIGAILTQNTSWTNVEKAISRLKEKKLISPGRLYNTDLKTVAELIRPCGYYNVKAARIRSFLETLFVDFKGDLSSMFLLKPALLRERLLRIKGIGPESADSILLYAAKRAVFVVDAYTRRFLLRHKLIERHASYEQVQSLFEENLPRRLNLFNEYHALIVRLAKEFCRKRPLCNICPLRIKKIAASTAPTVRDNLLKVEGWK
ncbi:MAG: endonuclease III domain-containing protein [Candidatus Omnitrophica bacterium]|nr:endonuclease III domain-containing protein [Candidatus Omnitrophota bacterium]MBU4140352.1 endonuclease III domain-containing protein [Candidatus Omnitrophota bacterium]